MNHRSRGQPLALQDMEYRQTNLAPPRQLIYSLTKPNVASNWFNNIEAYILARWKLKPDSILICKLTDKWTKPLYRAIRQGRPQDNLNPFWKISIRNLHHLMWRSHNKSQIEPSYSPGSIRWMIKHIKLKMQSSQQDDRIIPNSKRLKLHAWVKFSTREVKRMT